MYMYVVGKCLFSISHSSFQICEALSTPESYQSAVDRWCVPLLKKCEQYFSALIQNPGTCEFLSLCVKL